MNPMERIQLRQTNFLTGYYGPLWSQSQSARNPCSAAVRTPHCSRKNSRAASEIPDECFFLLLTTERKKRSARVRNESVKNTSRKKRTKLRMYKREAHTGALNTRLPIPAAACISRGDASSGAGEASLADSAAEASRVGAHDSILEAGADTDHEQCAS